MTYNPLIFGKDTTEKIVNLTLKGDQIHIYRELENGTVEHQIENYTPWVLSNKSLKSRSECLKGNQYWKYLTSTTTDKFLELQESWNRELWLPRTIEECFSLAEGVTYFKGMKANEPSVLSFDIETNGLTMNTNSKVFLISNTFRKQDQLINKLFCIDDYNDIDEMIYSWTEWVREVNPSILLGHNILSYDLPYLNYYAGALNLGRDNSSVEFAEKTSKVRKDGSQSYDFHNARIHGREIVDTFFLSMKYDAAAREFPSYGLKPIIKHLGLEKPGRTFIDASKIEHYYNNRSDGMWEKVKQYAIEDADDALKLYDLMIPSYFYMAQSMPKSLQCMINESSGSQLDALMIRSYLQDGHSQPRTSGKVPFEGAISMGISGIHKNVHKADVISLYPSIMLAYDIFNKEKDPNRHLLQLLEYYRDERIANKKKYKETGDKYYDDLQNSQKIAINSLYGFLGTGYLLYNYPEGGASVTRYGREILQKGVEWATGHRLEKVVVHIKNKGKENEEEEFEWQVGPKISEGRGYKVCNVDTDSFAVSREELLDKKSWNNELNELNKLYPNLIKWDDDSRYDKFIIVGAKNYILQKTEEDLKKGEDKVKFKGSSITDKKKEPALLEMLEKMLNAILNDQLGGLIGMYEDYIREAMNITNIKRWVNKKTVTKSVLNPERLTEQKVLDAMNEAIKKGVIESFAEGDKIWLFNAVNGSIQAQAKGMPIWLKDGSPKLIENRILRDERLFDGSYDKMHYVDRVRAVVETLSDIVPMSNFIDYGIKKNLTLLNTLTQAENHDRVG